jgi:GntR family transcriptional regulator
VYLQVVDQVKRDIALGRLVQEERLPTVRQLAQQLAINPNTIAKAYRQLEQEGIIVTRAGSGAFVANHDSNLSRTVRRKLICDELERIAVEAFHMQIDKQTLAEWFAATLEKFNLAEKQERQHG